MSHSLDVLLHTIIKTNRGLLIRYSKEQHLTVNVKEWLLKQKPSPYQFAEESGADKAKQWELQQMPASRRVHLHATVSSSGIISCKTITMPLVSVCCTRHSKHSGDFLFSCPYPSVTCSASVNFPETLKRLYTKVFMMSWWSLLRPAIPFETTFCLLPWCCMLVSCEVA